MRCRLSFPYARGGLKWIWWQETDRYYEAISGIGFIADSIGRRAASAALDCAVYRHISHFRPQQERDAAAIHYRPILLLLLITKRGGKISIVNPKRKKPKEKKLVIFVRIFIIDLSYLVLNIYAWEGVARNWTSPWNDYKAGEVCARNIFFQKNDFFTKWR